MSITLEQAHTIITGIFPRADHQGRNPIWDHHPENQKDTHTYRVGKHYIIVHPTVGMVLKIEWKAGGRWNWNVKAAKKLDGYHPRTENDLIGWVSYIWESICELAQNTLISQVDPTDLFPGGFKGPAGNVICTSVEVLEQCGKTKHGIIRYVADNLKPQWQFNRTQTAMVFKVNSSTEGKVVGRINQKFMGQWPFQWAYEFPMGWETVARKGEIHFKGAGTDVLPRAQKFLKRLYVKAVFDFLDKIHSDLEVEFQDIKAIP